MAWVGYPKSLGYGPQSLSLSIAGLDFEPNLWMWVDPNIMFPPGKLEVPEPSKGKNLTTTAPSPQPVPKEDFDKCPEATEVESLSPPGDQSSPWKQFATSPGNWEVGISGVGSRQGVGPGMTQQRALFS